jgi:hypothetical protein
MTIPNSSSDGLILLAHGTPNVLGEMDTFLKLVTGGRGVSSEVVRELQERYAQIDLGDEPQLVNELVGQVCGFLKRFCLHRVFRRNCFQGWLIQVRKFVLHKIMLNYRGLWISHLKPLS